MNPLAIINQALNNLGAKFKSNEAVILLLAIAFQESAFKHRRQFKGPARGFWQFERAGGVMGVLSHKTTWQLAAKWVETFGIGKVNKSKRRLISSRVHDAFERPKYDVLAAIFARLLLWSDPRPLPKTKEEAWEYYLDNWRPGKPHRNRWDESWEFALKTVEEAEKEEKEADSKQETA